MTLTHHRIWRWLLLMLLVVILFSPLVYWFTGVGQTAPGLSAEIGRGPDGTLTSSPKAEALHSLALPKRVERLLIYPLLLICFQFGGGSLALRRWLDRITQGRRQAHSVGLFGAVLVGRLVPRAWRERLPGRDLLVICLFVLIIEAVLTVLFLPFDYYGGFILARQFGLSVQTAPGWACWIFFSSR